MRFDPQDAIWLWRKWTNASANKLLALGVKVIAFVTIVSVAMAVLWWIHAEVAYRRCLHVAQGDDAARMLCLNTGVDMYTALGFYLLIVIAVPVIVLAACFLMRSVVGRLRRLKRYHRIPWWVSAYCLICLSGVAIQVVAWITFLAK